MSSENGSIGDDGARVQGRRQQEAQEKWSDDAEQTR